MLYTIFVHGKARGRKRRGYLERLDGRIARYLTDEQRLCEQKEACYGRLKLIRYGYSAQEGQGITLQSK